MTTAHDLMLVALGLPHDRPVEQGDLSLALAGAEAIDLLEAGALTLDGDLMVPGPRAATGERLLDDAAASFVRSEPYETVMDWLWRRGRDLTAAYGDDLTRSGLVTRPHRHGFGLLSAKSVLADSPARRRAEERKASGEPVLTGLFAEAGIGQDPVRREGSPDENPGGSPSGEAVETVLAAVGEAVTELEALRLRRDIENAAFDNMWRG
ncbi:GPP34 family phosphoprotein [Streptomyces sp. V4-01]|uniref:GPP34 family phosphoprotein n=1 Tax=Actinacidiphila polyblastidii TaxID=3110430 RepID=A0ABU7PMB2_9ACTN|nr:GPP34 family phosphoprotein [Streptomyces sp. V4-01]